MFSLPFPLLFGAWSSGAVTGLGLFAAVGAQSVFILRQGLIKAHLLTILTICGLLDAIFITSSVHGLQALLEHAPWLVNAVRWIGVAFLAWYAVQSAQRAWHPTMAPVSAAQGLRSRRAALLGAVGFTLLNPHFWLDMMVVGSLAQSFENARMAFAVGTMTASVAWLVVLGLGSRLFAPLFTRTAAWRVLDSLMAVVMLALAVNLALST